MEKHIQTGPKVSIVMTEVGASAVPRDTHTEAAFGGGPESSPRGEAGVDRPKVAR